ncbi:MAG: transcription antitermination factor NusB [Lachnospiraceae bacterium]|nr:transcription antitermination factor NusB [Lachnospiraceae bacterium]
MTQHDKRCELFKGVFLMGFFDEQEGLKAFELLGGKHITDEDSMDVLPEDVRQEIFTRLQDLTEHLSEIDEIIDQNATDWKRERMAKVDLAIIRLAVYETTFDDNIPEGVAINEAVEIAREFGGDSSPSFVNGVLGRISRKRD